MCEFVKFDNKTHSQFRVPQWITNFLNVPSIKVGRNRKKKTFVAGGSRTRDLGKRVWCSNHWAISGLTFEMLGFALLAESADVYEVIEARLYLLANDFCSTRACKYNRSEVTVQYALSQVSYPSLHTCIRFWVRIRDVQGKMTRWHQVVCLWCQTCMS